MNLSKSTLGIAAAIAAGLCWGLVFVAPLMLAQYPPHILAFGRYLAFGLIALPLAAFSMPALKRLSRADWWYAVRLSLVGNIIYYCALASAIQLAGAPAIGALIGTLPIVIAIASNRGAEKRPWSQLAGSLLLIAAGLGLLNYQELALQSADQTGSTPFFLGLAIGLIALVSWTWYPIKNTQWLKANPQHNSKTWATAQGLTTLPLAAIGYLFSAGLPAGFASTGDVAHFTWPLGPTPGYFIGMMLLLGLTASWLGTVFWNFASNNVPATLSGQLIVFETLAALAFAYSLRGHFPDAVSLLGIGLLVLGVVVGIRSINRS